MRDYEDNEDFEDEDDNEIDEIMFQYHLKKHKEALEEGDKKDAIDYYNTLYYELKDIDIDDIIYEILYDIELYDETSFENPFEEEHAHFSEMLHFLIQDEQYEKCIFIKKVLDKIEESYGEYLSKNTELLKVTKEIFGN